jgi:hypothetical protein
MGHIWVTLCYHSMKMVARWPSKQSNLKFNFTCFLEIHMTCFRKSYSGPSIDDSCKILLYLAKKFQRRFKKIDQSESKIAYDSHVCKRIRTKWAHFIEDLPQMLPSRFQYIWPNSFRGKYFEKSTNQKQEFPMSSMFVNGLGQNQQSL